MKYIILIILLLLITACTNVPTTPTERCKYDGGEWKEFSSGCADSCKFARSDGFLFCTQALVDSCDCGDAQCWNGTACEPN